jgi:hypothetical protein
MPSSGSALRISSARSSSSRWRSRSPSGLRPHCPDASAHRVSRSHPYRSTPNSFRWPGAHPCLTPPPRSAPRASTPPASPKNSPRSSSPTRASTTWPSSNSRSTRSTTRPTASNASTSSSPRSNQPTTPPPTGRCSRTTSASSPAPPTTTARSPAARTASSRSPTPTAPTRRSVTSSTAATRCASPRSSSPSSRSRRPQRRGEAEDDDGPAYDDEDERDVDDVDLPDEQPSNVVQFGFGLQADADPGQRDDPITDPHTYVDTTNSLCAMCDQPAGHPLHQAVSA